MSASDPGSERFQKALVRQITRSRRKVTIMFTDVEGSTSYWEKHGDVHGRLMVDLHNRLIVPLIGKFRGQVIKHVGDAIMASFPSPDRALRAAVGIQQILERQRARSGKLVPEVRIGIHTGKAVVEKKDVFGDMVNVASRVADHAIGGGICLSGSAAGKVKRKAFGLARKGAFKPRGRKQNIQLYECAWGKCPSFIEDVDEDRLPLVRRQKIELVIYALVTVAAVYAVTAAYLRPLISEIRPAAMLALRMSRLYLSPQLLAVTVAGGALAFLAWRFRGSHLLYRLMKAGFGLSAAFLLVFAAGRLLPPGLLPRALVPRWEGVCLESHGNLVEVLEGGVEIRRRISGSSAVVATARAGDILVVEAPETHAGRNWFRVALPGGKSGWLPKTIPAKIGVPERQVVVDARFVFLWKDLYALLAGLPGFLWGFVSFRIRPA